jgi:hypothetical protein
LAPHDAFHLWPVGLPFPNGRAAAVGKWGGRRLFSGVFLLRRIFPGVFLFRHIFHRLSFPASLLSGVFISNAGYAHAWGHMSLDIIGNDPTPGKL